jgi:hypothetical protein
MTYEEYQLVGALAGWPKCYFCQRFFDSTLQMNGWWRWCGVKNCATVHHRDMDVVEREITISDSEWMASR